MGFIGNRGRGLELGYAEITSDITTTNTSLVDIAGLATTVTVGARPIVIVVWAALVTHTVDQGAITVTIHEGATELARGKVNVSGANNGAPMFVRSRKAPSAGAHTYKARWSITTAGTGTMFVNGFPAHIQVIEV